jgi:hypothetical protein
VLVGFGGAGFGGVEAGFGGGGGAVVFLACVDCWAEASLNPAANATASIIPEENTLNSIPIFAQ